MTRKTHQTKKGDTIHIKEYPNPKIEYFWRALNGVEFDSQNSLSVLINEYCTLNLPNLATPF